MFAEISRQTEIKTSMNPKPNYLERAKALIKTNSLRAGALAVIPLSAMVAAGAPPRPTHAYIGVDCASGGGFDWTGGPDGTGKGNWSNAENWSPKGIPNDAAQEVCIYNTPSGGPFNGPTLDITVVLRVLNLFNGTLVNGVGFNNLTIVGGTYLAGTVPYGILSSHGGTFTLGTLANYDSSTSTLAGGGLTVDNGGTIRWVGANVVNNNGFLFISGATSRVLNQNGGASALTNLATNGGTLQFGNGFDFTTIGNFTNTGALLISGGPNPTTFMVSGQLTNFNASTHAISGGTYTIDDGGNSTATLQFPQADIQTLSNATVTLKGAGASITDLSGVDAFRNLKLVQGGFFTTGGTRTITPAGGTFTNDNSTHKIDSGATFTIQGFHNSINGGVTKISAPTANANTTLLINGSSVINGGRFDFGGQPGVNTIYTTTLQVINGIEFRGAYLTGTGTTYADIGLINQARLTPGIGFPIFPASPAPRAIRSGVASRTSSPTSASHSAGELTFHGNVILDGTTNVDIALGGYSPGLDFDVVTQVAPGNVTLGGNLNLSFFNGFEANVANSDTFDIITSQSPLQGSFANVASGSRLITANREGSFVVTYAGKNNVTLSNFMPIVPKIISFSLTSPGRVPTITFTTASGFHYAVERKDDLGVATWTTLGNASNISGNGNPISVADPDPGAGDLPKRFYHVVLLP
ncbi:MAG: hypothetical protein ACR2HH_01260 [Chthoniobacterales bacterium]